MFLARLLGGVALTCVLCSAAPAFAQSEGDKQVAAQTLYDRATELIKQKNYAEACPKLEEVTKLIPEGIGAKLTLAECYESWGKLASATAVYGIVESLATRLNQADRVELARERAATLRPKLAHLTIRVPAPVKALPGLRVTRNGTEVAAAGFDDALAADKGKHVIVAVADGKKTWQAEIEIPADGASLVVDVPPLVDDPNWKPAAPPGAPPTPPADEPRPEWLKPVGFVVGGVGVAGLGVAAAMGALALSKNSEADESCFSASQCTAAGNATRADAATFADVSTALFIAGGVLTAGGVVMIALAPWDSGDEAGAKPVARLGLGPTGVSFSLELQ